MPNNCFKTLTLQETYNLMFQEYPDLVNVTQLCMMLGGISTKTAYKILKTNRIDSFKIGRAYKIPKINIITYLHVINIQTSIPHCNALVH